MATDAHGRGSAAPSKLYVSNLSASATLPSVREFFRAAGEVLNVEFAVERNERPRFAALVTMATSAGAQAAIHKLNGRLFHDRSVTVSLDHGAVASRDGKEASEPKAKSAGVAITQQYRDRHGMAYELECAGVRLTLRFFFPVEGEGDARRVEARTNQGAEVVVTATAATRELALAAVAEAWRGLPPAPPAPALDWEQVTAALKTVRGI